ncbi:MAG: ammonium transporter [Ignavibacteriales bacterium]
MKKVFMLLTLMVVLMMFFQAAAFAEGAASIDTGDTTFVLISSALVFLMTPGLALFYGGMVRKKNVLNAIINVFFIIGLVSVLWVLIGYSLSFGPDKNGLIGSFQWAGFKGVGAEPNAAYAATIPHSAFAVFQLMFAIITVAIITGAFAERIKFSVLVMFSTLWILLVYSPLAHWVWGIGGWLRNLGALDFAGGTVVHISSGIAGLTAAIIIGKRKGYGTTPMLPHNIPFVVIGAAMLWFGWFGFNAGSALSANGLAVNAFLTTNTAAAAAMLSWMTLEWIFHRRPTTLGAATGGVVGLVAITPGAGFVDVMSAIIIGLIAAPLSYFAISVAKRKIGYDDSLDAFGCHGVGGTWGAIATGLFASKSINPAGANGLFFGNTSQLGIQLISVGATIVFSAVMTLIILEGIKLFTSLRVDEKYESNGLDIEQHGEDAYGAIYSEERIIAG